MLTDPFKTGLQFARPNFHVLQEVPEESEKYIALICKNTGKDFTFSIEGETFDAFKARVEKCFKGAYYEILIYTPYDEWAR